MKSAAAVTAQLLAILILAAGFASGQELIVDGSWGGLHIKLDAVIDGATVELDCADGEVAEPIIAFGPEGEFSAVGTFTPGHPGPVFFGEIPDRHPAIYSGTVRDDLMELTITVQDTGEEIGPFELMKGEPAQVFRCL